MAVYGPYEHVLSDGRRILLRNCTGHDSAQYPIFREKIASESTHTLQYVGQTIPDAESLRARWQAGVTDEVTLYLGAFHESRLVGILFLYPDYPGHPWVRHIGHFGMMILQEFWGVGLGKQLLRALDDHAGRVGLLRLEAMVRIANQRGVRLYRGAGYEIEGTRRKAALIDGKYQDEYLIAKVR